MGRLLSYLGLSLLCLSLLGSFLWNCPSPAAAGPLSEIILLAAKPYRYYQLYSLRPDGKDLRPILDVRRDCREPNLCRQTNEIVFSMRTIEGGWNLFLTDLQGSYLRRLTDTNYDDRHPVWSPDGSQIAFETNRWGSNELALLDLKTKKISRLTHDAMVNGSPVWSPRGRHLALVSWRRGAPHLYAYDLQSGNLRPLTKTFQAVSDPTWSPDGQYLAFRGRSYFGLFLATIDRHRQLKLYRQGTERASFPAWSPNGDQILFSEGNATYQRLSLLDLESGQIRTLIDLPAPAYDLVWQAKTRTWD